ncbi:MAG: hypothetical protein MJK15_13685 [Colwellia sp.]|nr:hypothetical protein [Colwellia sp.]
MAQMNMREAFIFLVSALFIFFLLAFAWDDYRFSINTIGIYCLTVYWGLGYKWSYGKSQSKSHLTKIVKNGLILITYISFGYLVVSAAFIQPEWKQSFFSILWSVITTLLVIVKWERLKADTY